MGKSLASLALLITSLLAAPCLIAARQTPAQTPDAQASEKRPGLSADARARARKAVTSVGLVLVRRSTDSPAEKPRPRGSAVVIRKDGTVATNYHVIVEDKSGRPYDEIYFSLPAGETQQNPVLYRLEPLLMERRYDLALLRVVKDSSGRAASELSGFPVLEIGDSRGVKLLDDLVIIGFPEKGGTSVTVNTGIVEGTDVLENWIKTDARLIHGNSGGAAIDSDGKLIGIPTKVVADRQPVDKNGDGFPDEFRFYGAVGFLRPAHLLADMLEQFESRGKFPAAAPNTAPVQASQGAIAAPKQSILIRGIIKSARDGKPIAGARVGLTPAGSEEVSVENLLSWGGSNGEGAFSLNRPVPAGRYTLIVRAFKYEAYAREVDLDGETQLVIEMRPSP
ncbi:MAG TPA: trypsin-like peptidase domain-containing protein [Blastocatellia bacterium]|jgi:S1-C subfamily serine protease|nr:trypsin-like peptidase domain-containing protein [Blastocatellia bacterium]